MDFLKKYKPWEIVVALLPPLFAIDEIWHSYADDYPSALYQIVKHVFAFGYIAILLYSVYCMYRGAKWSGRFPKLMLTLLITLTAAKLLAFVNGFFPQDPLPDLFKVFPAVQQEERPVLHQIDVRRVLRLFDLKPEDVPVKAYHPGHILNKQTKAIQSHMLPPQLR